MPKLSIITINYNNLEGLKRTVASVLNQTWQEFEYIVIDGGSTDGSAEYLKDNNSAFTYWVSEEDKGVYNAMNKGISKAKGEYLFFLNSGDHFNDSFSLSKVYPQLFDEDFIYFDIRVIENNTSFVLENPKEFSFEYLHNNLPCHQCTFIKKHVFDKIGNYDENLKIVADWKFLLIAILKNNCTYRKVEDVVTTFYKGGLSSTADNQLLINCERKTVLESEFPVLLNDLNENFRMQRVIRNLNKSRKINWLIKLGLLDKF